MKEINYTKLAIAIKENEMRSLFEEISGDYEMRIMWIKNKLPWYITKFCKIRSTEMYLQGTSIFIGVNFGKSRRANCYIEITPADIEEINSKWRKMEELHMQTNGIIHELRRLKKAHKNDKLQIFGNNWSLMCHDVANKLEELQEENEKLRKQVSELNKNVRAGDCMKTIEKQKEEARDLNELMGHLTKVIESDDKRFSFEFSAGGTMEIYDKTKDIGYAVHVAPIEYDSEGNAKNL